MGSRKRQPSKILGVVTAIEAERLLIDWVNLKPEDAPRFLTHWQPLIGRCLNPMAYRDLLRKAWDAPNARNRSWYLFMVRHAYAYEQQRLAAGWSDEQVLGLAPPPPEQVAILKDFLSPPPEISAVEAAVYYLQEGIGDRAKHCGYEGCVNPYFVAAKRWQKYCTEECAAPSNKAQKRAWWKEHGKGSKKGKSE